MLGSRRCACKQHRARYRLTFVNGRPHKGRNEKEIACTELYRGIPIRLDHSHQPCSDLGTPLYDNATEAATAHEQQQQ